MSDIVEALGAVPVTPAPLIATYPQFCETAIPAGCEATRAYRGYIRPFSDDATARRVLRALTANKALSVASGRLDSEAIGLPHHPLEDYLLNMAEPCTVVVLEFDGKEHPRAYLVDPPLIRRLSTNAHLRWDKSLLIEGRRTPALCIYSGNLFKYDPSYERLSQFLNQLSTYLAKHLIFLRTRTLHTLQKDGTLRPRKRRKPWEPVKLGTLTLSKTLVWFGHWAGLAAPSGVLQHLRTVEPNGECWCNSGKLYKDCHRPEELEFARRVAHSRPLAPPQNRVPHS